LRYRNLPLSVATLLHPYLHGLYRCSLPLSAPPLAAAALTTTAARLSKQNRSETKKENRRNC